MTDTVQALLELQHEVDAELKVHALRRDVLQRKRDAVSWKLQTICEHPEDQHVKTSHYHSGGYDHRSYTSYELHCKVCGRLLEARDGPEGSFQ